jgi:hypothetical protein
MSTLLKGILFSSTICGCYLIHSIVKNNYPKKYLDYKIKVFIYGIKMYSKFQICRKKMYLLVFPYYNKIKNFFFPKDLINGPDSFLYFYKNNELIYEFKLTYKQVIEDNLLPIEVEDLNNIEFNYDSDKLKLFIKDYEPKDYDFLVIENRNKKKTDIIFRSKDNAYDIDKLEYSKNDFLLIQLIISTESKNIELMNDVYNFNITGNRIDKNFIFLYKKYIDMNLVKIEDYSLFIVDKDLEQFVLNNNDSIKLEDGKYISYISSSQEGTYVSYISSKKQEDENVELIYDRENGKDETYDIIN